MAKARGLPLKTVGIFWLAAIIGVLGGVLGVAFLALLQVLQSLWAEDPEMAVGRAAAKLSPWMRLWIPAAGGLLAGLVLWKVKNERGPFGIADVMELIVSRKGRIRPLRSLTHILSSALSIASGGSIGKEGANSQFGATIGSVLGRSFDCSARTKSVLLGCGIAAGMSAAYKAPIAGAIFVMEVVLGSFAMDVMAPIVVASVLSTLVTKALLDAIPFLTDYRPTFESQVEIQDWYLILSAVLLGAICGVGGILFRKSLAAGNYLFAKMRLPLAIKMALGGLIVGFIGMGWPEVWGNGQNTIKDLIDDQNPVFFALAAILILKVIATSASTGSGGLGGVFTPNLVVGAFFGAAFAAIIGNVIPVGAADREGFTLVGMAGLCAATTHAPITAILLIFEMTSDYGLILPLMLCSITASITSSLIDQDSIYSERLRARGHGDTLQHGIEELAMHGTYVRDVMRKDQAHVLETAGFDEILEIFNTTRRDTVYVTDKEHNLIGHIQLHDIKYYLNDASLGSLVIAGDLTRTTPTSSPEDTLASIIARFDDPDLGEMPVVTAGPSPLLQGRLTRRDLMTCLSEEVLGKRNLRAKLKTKQDSEATYVELPDQSSLARIQIPDDFVGRSFDTLDFHASHGLIVMLLISTDESGIEQRFLPEPQTLIAPKTSMIMLGQNSQIKAFEDQHGLAK